MTTQSMTSLLPHLTFLYGAELATSLLGRVQALLEAHHAHIPAQEAALSERDSILITYGDQVQTSNEKPLQTLHTFCNQYIRDIVSGIHILPFYPWTSDDGFSVRDYRQVDPALGEWQDVSDMQDHFRLMFDAVINHISSQSAWFQAFLNDDPRYRDYFITIAGKPDLSQVVRPRTLPLLTIFHTPSGEKRLWTTFSADQIDLNYKNPEVLLDILDILLLYAEQGASFLRLDAIAYLWKELGTPCIHLPQTHHVIQFLRAALDEVAPHVQLITETNVPHADNLSYFGDGTNEAQLVYNFALPPLTLHTFHTGDARILSDWARTLTLPSDKTTFFNFLASHDGIGLNPARGILSQADIDSLVEQVLTHGGLISYKQNADGTQSPYEMNINYFDALSNPLTLALREAPPWGSQRERGGLPSPLWGRAGESAPKGYEGESESLDLQVDRFIAAQAIMLSLIGVPGIYFHSLFGSRGWMEGVKITGHNRTINREKLRLDRLESDLTDSTSIRYKVFTKYSKILSTRRDTPAFHPHGHQTIPNLHPSIFALERTSPNGTSRVLCLHNVSQQEVSFSTNHESAIDLFTGQEVSISTITLAPYEVKWLKLN